RHRAREPVNLGHHQRNAASTRCSQRLRQLGSVGTLAAFDLGKLSNNAPIAPVEVTLDGSALRLDAQATIALFASGNSVVSDEAPVRHHFSGVFNSKDSARRRRHQYHGLRAGY